MARSNGGIIGKKNVTSFANHVSGQTVRTSDTPSAVTTQAGTRLIQTLIVAGGGGGGGYTAGGGAGGYRCVETPVNGGAPYAITVGGGGAGSPTGPAQGTDGSDSVFSTLTSTGGGGGAGDSAPTRDGRPGGSGGANGYIPGNPVLGCIGAGNTPPVSPPQGFPSGNTNSDSATYTTGGGGGGASAVGGNASCSGGATGGAGSTSDIKGS